MVTITKALGIKEFYKNKWEVEMKYMGIGSTASGRSSRINMYVQDQIIMQSILAFIRKYYVSLSHLHCLIKYLL